jgi:hypothetical protein
LAPLSSLPASAVVTDMARKSIVQEVDDTLVDGRLRSVFNRLWEGVRGSGVYLTGDECAALLHKMPKPSEPPQWMQIAVYRYEHDGHNTQPVIRDAMIKFRVSRSEVFAARRRFKDYCKTLYSRAKFV